MEVVETVTRAEAARRLGISHQAIQSRVARGTLVLVDVLTETKRVVWDEELQREAEAKRLERV